MDQNAQRRLLNPSELHSPVVYRSIEENGNGVIDLGLSLSTQQPEAPGPARNSLRSEGLSDWVHEPNPRLKSTSSSSVHGDCVEMEQCVQSKERQAYVKANMDGVGVGRKICLLHHSSYSSLALQLENMFGGQCSSGLQLLQAGSDFDLFYKGSGDNWRMAGDVPWENFVECVKRLRIVRK